MRSTTDAFKTELEGSCGASPRKLLEIRGGTALASSNVLWDANLISIYHFDKVWTDGKGSNDGTRSGTGTTFNTANQKLGTAAGMFNGIDDKVQIADDATLDFGTGDFSLTFWARFSSTANYQVIIGKQGSGWADNGFVFLYTGGNIVFTPGTAGSTIVSKAWTPDGLLHHWSATREGTTAKIYLDGELWHSVTDSTIGNTADNAIDMYFGWTAGFGYYDGILDEVAIFNRLLSPTEISTLYIEQRDLLYSDQTIVIDAQTTYLPKVLEFGNLTTQIVPGEKSVRVASMSFKLSNIDSIDDIIVAGTEIRVYDWFVGLASVDKSLVFIGNISDRPTWDDMEISFSAKDIFHKFNKKIGRPVTKADWPNADPDYYGRIIPFLIGASEHLECLPVEAGASSTLREEFVPGDTSIKLTSATSPLSFPGAGTVIIGLDEHTYSGVSTNDLTGVPSPSIGYSSGTIVLLKTNVKLLAGRSFTDTPVKGISNVRVLPSSIKNISEAIAVDAAYYSINLTELIGGNRYATVLITDVVAVRKQITLQLGLSDVGHQHLGSGTPSTIERRANSYSVVSGVVTNPGQAYDLLKGDTTTYAHIGTGSQIRFNIDASSPPSGTITKVTIKFYAAATITGVTMYAGGQTFSFDPYINWKSIVVPITTWADMWIRFDTASSSVLQVYDIYAVVEYSTATLTSNNTTSIAVSLSGNTVIDTLGKIIVDFEGCKDDTSGTYTGTPSALIEKPPDVLSFLWRKLSNGAISSNLDLANSFLDARNNLPASYKFGVAITWQASLNILSAELAQMAHSRFFISAGVAKFARILDSGAAVKNIDTDDYSILQEGQEKKLRVKRYGRAIEEIINKVEIRYKHNPILGSKDDPDSYADNSESLTASAQSSIDTYGEQRKTWLMWAVRDATMADDLRDKILARNKDLKTTTVFPSIADLSLLEPSDLISLTSRKLRINSSLSEVLLISNISQVPKNFQATEIIITVQEL